jgi:hypothetical protein
VQALKGIYSDTGVRRKQNAAQFLKMAGEFMDMQHARREARAGRWVRSVTRPSASETRSG